MKKSVIALSVGLGLAACGPTQEQIKQQQLQNSMAEADALESSLAQEKDLIQTVRTFLIEFGEFTDFGDHTMCHGNNYVAEFSIGDELTYQQKVLAEPNIQYECFVADGGEFTDSSDDCILARRNTHKSSVCYFNYKKYLPETAKIKTDADFIYIANFYYQMMAKCQNMQEKTSSEIEQCKTNAGDFIVLMSQGKAPHCRDKEPEKYKQFLKEMARAYGSAAGMVDQALKSKKRAEYADSFYRDLFASSFNGQFMYEINAFSYTYQCQINGFEKDYKKVSGTNSSNSGGIIDLN